MSGTCENYIPALQAVFAECRGANCVCSRDKESKDPRNNKKWKVTPFNELMKSELALKSNRVFFFLSSFFTKHIKSKQSSRHKGMALSETS